MDNIFFISLRKYGVYVGVMYENDLVVKFSLCWCRKMSFEVVKVFVELVIVLSNF